MSASQLDTERVKKMYFPDSKQETHSENSASKKKRKPSKGAKLSDKGGRFHSKKNLILQQFGLPNITVDNLIRKQEIQKKKR
mmetsp:Transcript_6533/g.10499  ORF Transcript_6533/g.10499 Transcript_6533/m.10499 type:complete len:82 (+) Transcript_6533:773-1018(+)|eukprot:CAMPEP_0170484740 /NCGR_PEP_ID=MMETSP0208-20121228/4140_1 /TAXON_ID=197538 /ORGANISM="Strombidium inclinatum, Strain S3" /LENGTH=81 /DNA_ID=CAMNT_0010758155 /DNA_START=772 /DNA_END=1017 /DNA_ORIENTATION=-